MFENRTLRLIVRLHASGRAVRFRLSNTFGDRPVTFGRVRVGVRSTGPALVAGTNRPVTFAGTNTVTVPVGAEVQSDPLQLAVKSRQDLAVSLFIPGQTGTATWHRSALQTSYLSIAGDHAGNNGANPYTSTIGNWFFLDAVSTQSSTAPGTIAALGDSITDGSGSSGNANRRWPDVLSSRLLAQSGGVGHSVVNEGIAGNRVLTDDARNGASALHRLSRDVLVRKGLTHVILLEGINDLRSSTAPATAAQIIAGYRQIIDRVHAKGVRIIGGTILPAKGSGRYTAALERERAAVNSWIRTSGQFDGVVDFDAATRDPADPLRLRPEYDRGDHLHPNDAGYAAMGRAVDLALFQP
jgi:lysophospholipase L1-like esterase